jgi:hypothetical protein
MNFTERDAPEGAWMPSLPAWPPWPEWEEVEDGGLSFPAVPGAPTYIFWNPAR